MSTQDTNTVLDELTKTYNQSNQEYLDAIDALNKKRAEIASRPTAPGQSYEDFLKEAMPEKPTTVVNPKKEKSRMLVSNIGDAINAIGGIVGAGIGADVAPMASLSAANQARHDKLIAQRKAEQDAYNRGAMQAHSYATSMADFHTKQQERADAKELAPYEDAVARAKVKVGITGDQRQQAYREHRDAVGDESRISNEQQQERFHQDDLTRRDRTEERLNRQAVDEHNARERNLYSDYNGSYVLKTREIAFIDNVCRQLIQNPAIAQKYPTEVAKINNSNIGDDEKLKEMKKIVSGCANSSQFGDAFRQAAEASNMLGQPDFWTYGTSAVETTPLADDQTGSALGTTPSATQLRTQSVRPTEEQTAQARTPMTQPGEYARQYSDITPFYKKVKEDQSVASAPKKGEQKSENKNNSNKPHFSV